MAFTYAINPRGGDIHDVAPYWFAAFIRFETRDSFSRTKMAQSPQNCSGIDTSQGVSEQELLLADDDVVSWQVSTSKSSHVSSFNATLTAGNVDYESELASGDWMGFWAFDNKQDFIRVRKLVKGAEQCNAFLDGLKFVGRVDAVRRKRSRMPNTGTRTVQYTLTGKGFSEFDATIYYNPYFKAKYGNDALLWMMDFGGAENNLILGSTKGKGLLNSQEVIPRLMRICFGVQDTSGGEQKTQSSDSDTTQDTTVSKNFSDEQNAALNGTLNKGYLVPQTIGKWLGATSNVKGSLSYVDILRMYVGIQEYKDSGSASRTHSTPKDVQPFVPNWSTLEQNVYNMYDDLTGEYRVLTMNFDNKSVWSILHTYINEPIDEMYTCLRVQDDGSVMPTLVCRQNPMSTQWYADNGEYKVTSFTSLPRWKIHSDIVQDEDVGRSDSMRFNYLQFLGQDMSGTNTQDNQTVGFARNPPIVDPTDANRSGLRMYEKQLSANVNEALFTNSNSPGDRWQKIMADILMGGHLKYTGTLICKGIQEPICEGDNVEYDDVIYHIESVGHSGSISPFGPREFSTTLQLTNGIDIANETSGDTEIFYPDLRETNQSKFKATVVEREDDD